MEEVIEAAEESAGSFEPELTAVTSDLPLTAVVSAMLFSAGRPLSVSTIAAACERGEAPVQEALEQLKDAYSDDVHGFSLYELQNGWQLRSAPGAAYAVRRLRPAKVKRISRAAAETLAVIAYKQPVGRADVESIRGVDALPTLKTLLDAKLIRVVGHDAAVGKPALYGTTEYFLERYGLKDLGDLPTLKEMTALESEPGEVEEAYTDEEVPAAAEDGTQA